MRTYLKHLTAVTFIVFAVAFSAVARESNAVEETFIQNHALEMLEMDLHRSDVPGIVKSAIYTIVECKNSFPDLDYSRLLSTLNKVANKSDKQSIGYEAQLASMYLSHSSDIWIVQIPDAEHHEYLFKQIADQLGQLEQKLLARQSDQNITAKK